MAERAVFYFGGENTPQLVAVRMKAAERTCPKGYPAPWGGVVHFTKFKHEWVYKSRFFVYNQYIIMPRRKYYVLRLCSAKL